MSEPFARLRRFLRELKRRNVYKVAVTYAVVAFIVWQVANLLFPALGFPEWTVDFVIILTLLGLPLALVVTWAFEMTPEGMRRTEAPEGERTGGSEAYKWVGLALVVLLAGGVWYATTADGGKPAAETTATTDSTAARTASTARDSVGPPRIAVLPFENIARDTGNAFFALGMHEEVLNQLSKVSGLAVLSRTTMMEMADAGMTASEIGRELDADAILEGTVRRAGNRVRITTQLIETPADEHLWSNTYDRALSVEEIFDIQADIADRIAGSLETQLAEGERRRIEDAPTDDLAAYDAYLQGRSRYFQFWATLRPADIRRSIEAFRKAIRRDSSFAEAHAWLGSAYALGGQFIEAEGGMDSASVAVERARAIEPDLAAVHLAQAWIYEAQDSTSAQIASLRRALELQPSHPFAKSRLSDALAADMQHVEALRVAREAVQLAPRQPAVLQEMSDQLAMVGFYDAAAAWDRHILEIEPRHIEAIVGLASNQSGQGHPEQALATWKRYLEGADAPYPAALYGAAEAALRTGQPEQAKAYLEQIPEARRQRRPDRKEAPSEGGIHPANRGFLGLAELRLGNRGRGRQLLQQAADSARTDMENTADSAGPLFFLAETQTALGQSDRALEYLDRWLDTEPNWRPGTFHSPFFDDLRSDPRFQTIVRDVEAQQAKLREEVRQLGIDLYPPGAESDSVTVRGQTDG